jgi:hypothetical protein
VKAAIAMLGALVVLLAIAGDHVVVRWPLLPLCAIHIAPMLARWMGKPGGNAPPDIKDASARKRVHTGHTGGRGDCHH